MDRLMAIFYSIVEGKVVPTANIFTQVNIFRDYSKGGAHPTDEFFFNFKGFSENLKIIWSALLPTRSPGFASGLNYHFFILNDYYYYYCVISDNIIGESGINGASRICGFTGSSQV